MNWLKKTNAESLHSICLDKGFWGYRLMPWSRLLEMRRVLMWSCRRALQLLTHG